ncbi:hypothetical protein [Streptomyces sp. NPDC004284]|uniref:hypothetical protein n=1 Tax=Streptomyces sp. NPDC004284 TaxID=3364695 RepID=UPI0036ACBD88
MTGTDPGGTATHTERPLRVPVGHGAERRIEDTLAALPGRLAAAAPLGAGRHAVGLRDGRLVEAAATGPGTGPEFAAAVAYACLPPEGTARLRVDARPTGEVGLAPDGVRPRPPVSRPT